MKLSALISVSPLLSAVIASPATPLADAEPWLNKFILQSRYGDTPYTGHKIQAANSRFWLGGSPKTYCPKGPCPDEESTVIKGNHFKDFNHLDVGVKGGQAIYVDPDAALRYVTTKEHEIPSHSYTGGYKLTYGINFQMPRWGASGRWLACDVPKHDQRQIFADVKNATIPGCANKLDCCVGLFLTAYNYTGPSPPAYEYR
ncbi:hypothetical protein FQN57_002487 [Myotisia sp. PD_48]|nr:hypothetical protein FQN57_002487 [Myotisia sp. PD_48]